MGRGEGGGEQRQCNTETEDGRRQDDERTMRGHERKRKGGMVMKECYGRERESDTEIDERRQADERTWKKRGEEGR